MASATSPAFQKGHTPSFHPGYVAPKIDVAQLRVPLPVELEVIFLDRTDKEHSTAQVSQKGIYTDNNNVNMMTNTASLWEEWLLLHGCFNSPSKVNGTGIVHKDVDASKLADSLVHSIFHLGVIPYVYHTGETLAPSCLHCVEMCVWVWVHGMLITSIPSYINVLASLPMIP